MALKMTMTETGNKVFMFNGVSANFGEETKTFDDVYITVDKVESTKNEGRIIVKFAAESATWFKEFDFIPSMTGLNFIAQGYAHLKTLPEFSNALDC